MAAATPPSGLPLVGRFVRLDPVQPSTTPRACTPSYTDPVVYTQGYVMRPPPADLAETRARLAADIAARERRPHGIHGAAGRWTARSARRARSWAPPRSGDLDLANERVHLGWTMYGSRWWGTAGQPRGKLLLLGHAFEDCGFGRVKIQTDLVNQRSQAAIARLGATREGVLRRHTRRADGTFRDTVVFSILREEWPPVRAGLRERLGATSPADGRRPRSADPVGRVTRRRPPRQPHREHDGDDHGHQHPRCRDPGVEEDEAHRAQGRHGRPEPQQQHGAAVAVADLEHPVVQVLGVRAARAAAPGGSGAPPRAARRRAAAG